MIELVNLVSIKNNINYCSYEILWLFFDLSNSIVEEYFAVFIQLRECCYFYNGWCHPVPTNVSHGKLYLLFQCCEEDPPNLQCCISKQSSHYFCTILTPGYIVQTWCCEYTHLFDFICVELNNRIFKHTRLQFRLETVKKFSSNIIFYALNAFEPLKIIKFDLSEKHVREFDWLRKWIFNNIFIR